MEGRCEETTDEGWCGKQANGLPLCRYTGKSWIYILLKWFMSK